MIGVTLSGADVGYQVQPDGSIRDVIWTIGREHAPRYGVHAYRGDGGGSQIVEHGLERPRIDEPYTPPERSDLIGTCQVALWMDGGPLVPAEVYRYHSDDPRRKGEFDYDMVVDVDGAPGKIESWRVYPLEIAHWNHLVFWDESAQTLTNDLFAVLVPV